MKTFHSRISCCSVLAVLFLFGLLGCARSGGSPESQPASGINPDQALARLLEGNGRFAGHRSQRPRADEARLREVETGQHPIAAILSCSDSRVPPELIFDQGLGDLFVVRVAGNIADDAAIGSLEYAVEHLGVPLVMVIGHQSCGAVKAAVEGGEAHKDDHIHTILKSIAPVVEEGRKDKNDPVDACVRLNAVRVVGQLEASEPILAKRARESKVRIVGAYYSLKTGGVTLLPPPSSAAR